MYCTDAGHIFRPEKDRDTICGSYAQDGFRILTEYPIGYRKLTGCTQFGAHDHIGMDLSQTVNLRLREQLHEPGVDRQRQSIDPFREIPGAEDALHT